VIVTRSHLAPRTLNKEDAVHSHTGDVSIGFVSTYPPTVCGLASYTASLTGAIAADRGSPHGLGVVDVGGGGAQARPSAVEVHRHRAGDAGSVRRVARILNQYEVVSIQHEFGIFAGRDGAEVIDLIEAVDVPLSVTLHTVRREPTVGQAAIMQSLADRADLLVVMSEAAATRLTGLHGVDPDRVAVIPHGANTRLSGPSLAHGSRPIALTWGLLGPGKGLESAIEACVGLLDMDPPPRYIIAGATHPNVRRHSGEAYRQGLMSLSRRLGVSHIVEFDNRYLDPAALATLVRSSDVVVLPYESTEQVTSGVLVEAIAAGKPVVATAFPHAAEILATGAGVVVPHGDTDRLAAALELVLTDSDARLAMGGHARRIASGWFWPTIGRQFSTAMANMADSSVRRVSPGLEVSNVAG
jgi:polysaccharide biosynthesis protein PslF